MRKIKTYFSIQIDNTRKNKALTEEKKKNKETKTKMKPTGKQRPVTDVERIKLGEFYFDLIRLDSTVEPFYWGPVYNPVPWATSLLRSGKSGCDGD